MKVRHRSDLLSRLMQHSRLAGIATAAVTVMAMALTIVPAGAQSVTQTYLADSHIQPGMIIQLDGADKGRVKPASSNNLSAIHGVVVQPNDAPLTLSATNVERQVYVATSGTYTILVSDESGPIKKDDYIALSSIDGVGMLANPLPNVIAGRAVTGFDGKSNVKSQATVKDSNGRDRVVKFGYVTANINVTRNPLVRDKAPVLPGFLKQAAEGVADKPVSPLRAYLSVIVLVMTTLIVIVVVATGIRSSLISLGRNPLARASISRNLVQIVLIAIMILIVGLTAVYLLLKF